MDISNTMIMEVNENTQPWRTDDYEAASEATEGMQQLKVVDSSGSSSAYRYVQSSCYLRSCHGMTILRKAMNDLGVTGMTVTQVMGCGVQKGAGEIYRGVEMDATLLPKVKVEVVVSKHSGRYMSSRLPRKLCTPDISAMARSSYTMLTRVVKVRTGEEDTDALQDVE